MRHKPVLVAMMMLALAFGVAMSMSAYTILHTMARDPIPEKSARLYAVQIDNGGPRSRKPGDDEPPVQVSWRDASALLAMHRATHEAAMLQVGFSMKGPADAAKPEHVAGRATSAPFFSMFDVPLRYGRGWTDAEEADRARVAVISAGLNDRVFNGENSVGRTLVLNGDAWRVIGVAGPWDPRPRFFDVEGGQAFDEGEDIYVPLKTAVSLEMSTAGYEYCDAGPRGQTYADLLASECVWLQYWAELPTAAAATSYADGLTAYAEGQRRAGRFGWPANVRLRNVPDWLVARKIVSDDARLSVIVAFAFLGICMVCALALMLARSLDRSGEYSLRRALGATRRTVFFQAATEAGLIGTGAGVLGLVFTLGSLAAMRSLFPGDLARVAWIDGPLLAGTILLAAASAVVAGVYPAWLAMRTTPGLQLKGGL
ncbi:ABC transporter permease [Luteibacter aegosomaticola]|uniref:ABC transporter permease n=1 Tax=Luteibacter aegosomaticola TaxID=2911538 RepID=UPI001FF7C164|nr:ABC transporter permease [Luteibacter aegosomaticola]UPG88399.1 ABC transporter permease [Luteibacter aegosomaticola]